MALAVQGYNTVVKVSLDLGVTWHEIAKCKQSGIFAGSRATVDTTHMRSPGGHREKQTTLRDTAPQNLDVIYDSEDPTHADDSPYGLHALFINDTLCRMSFALASGKEFIYEGKVTAFDVKDVDAENVAMASATFTPLKAPLSEP